MPQSNDEYLNWTIEPMFFYPFAESLEYHDQTQTGSSKGAAISDDCKVN